ncbi:PREDICTED: uncharacterized protein LOC109221003 [Nicotiana attenuata]|uniref:uncharacterized protein LOC109221003 n=1 Tax=Nicotiana attenuata TaxID=49451 RepID=UPI0009052125|nr:PREDICTED: uncharacterized protein LOC109221003 [Nicotiana attenuata]
MHRIDFVALQEPFLSSDQIDDYRNKLGYDNAVSNARSKNGCFWNSNLTCTVKSKRRQQITFHIHHTNNDNNFWFTIVYARSRAIKRRRLWNKLRSLSRQIHAPWSIAGDFNSIMTTEEKSGGNPHCLSKSTDFISCMEECGMTDPGFTGSPFTWCNGRSRGRRISKRLDGVLMNEEWDEAFNSVRIDHQSKTGSDHKLLLIRCTNDRQKVIKYFKFLNFWTDREDFLSLVESCWNTNVQGNPMWILQQKLKALAKSLSRWSRDTIGDVQENVKQMEENTRLQEEAYDLDDSEENRQELHKSQAEYIRWLKMQDSILKQKARVKWAEEGDTNSKYFHSVIRERRRKTQLHMIKNRDGDWVEGNRNIAQAAIEHFSEIFSQPNNTSDMEIVRKCEKLITDADNELLQHTPTIEEVK